MDLPCLFDTPGMYKVFLKEVDALPETLQQALTQWHTRLLQRKRGDVCIFAPEAAQAYQRYKDAILELSYHQLPASAHNRGLAQMYDTLAQDALLVAALNASIEQKMDGPTVITLPSWAVAQEFSEWLRQRYHHFTAEEREKALFLTTGLKQTPGYVTIQGFDLAAVPFFLYAYIVVQTDEPKFHWFRLLAQRAYFIDET